jgi:hypothetical protein
MLTLEQARASLSAGGPVAAVQMLRTARAENDFAAAWLLTRAAQIAGDQLAADAVEQEALNLFDWSELFAGRDLARIKPEEIDEEAAIKVMGLCIRRAMQDARRDKTVQEWLLNGGADDLLKSIGLDIVISRAIVSLARRV